MDKTLFYFKDSKSYTEGSNLQSLVIDWLRFPLAIAVVFIHSFGSKKLDLEFLHSNPFSLESLYDFLRITLSNVGTHFAVPVFFMFSGFLFFYKVKEFNTLIYKQKIKKRFKSLFIPYICWIVFFVMNTEIRKVAGVFFKGKPISGIWQYIIDNGGFRLFWDSNVWGTNYQNWLGYTTPMSSPILVPLWFVRDLMIIVLLTPVIYMLIKRFRLIPVFILGFCYVSGIWIQIPGFTITTFFWFTLGAYFSINGKNMIESIYKWRIPSYIVCICTLLPLIWLNGRKGDGVSINAPGLIIYPFYVIASSFSIVCFATTLIQNGKVRVYPYLAKISFFVFLCHIFVLGYASRIVNKILFMDNYIIEVLKYLTTPIATVLICLGIYWLLDKYLPKFLSFITGSRI